MFKKLTSIIVISLVVSCFANAAVVQTSVWEHSGAEICDPAPVFTPGTSPLTYGPTTFDREREIYSYYPRFKPNVVTFDNNNRPYIMVAKFDTENPADNTYTYFAREWYDSYYIQTLDENNQWVTVDIDQLFEQIPGLDSYEGFQFRTGVAVSDDQIAFDSQGGIYFYVTEPRGLIYGTTASLGNYAFYCPDGNIANWQSYLLPGSAYYFETGDTFISDQNPPTLMAVGGGKFGVMDIVKKADSTLSIDSDSIIISDPSVTAATGPLHSGIVKSSVTVGNKVHCVYLDADNVVNETETAQYYCSYDKLSGQISTPVLLGSTVGFVENGNPDPHNGPAITVDADKTLHVVLGAHGSMMKYTYSTDLGKTWSTVTDLFDDATYPSLVSTPDGTLHLVYRKSSVEDGEFKYRLWYARKAAGGAWQDMGCLIEPARNPYNIYYHMLTVDRTGRLFLSYYYLIANFTEEELQAADEKWPSDPPMTDHIGYPHDAAILMSADNGDHWKLATTKDFVDGVKDVEAYYDFEGEDSKLDSSGKERNLTGDASSVASVNGKGVYFNGTTDSLTSGFSQQQEFTTGGFSLFCRANPAVVPASPFQVVCGSQSGGPAGILVMVSVESYRVYVYAGSDADGGGYYQGFNTNTVLTPNNWTNLAVTFEAQGPANADGNFTGTLKVYMDGELKVDEQGVKYEPAAGGLTIGSSNDGSNKFNGIVDDVVVYNFALSSNQVTKLNNLDCNPKAIHSEQLLEADLNQDGLVDQNDLLLFADQFLVK